MTTPRHALLRRGIAVVGAALMAVAASAAAGSAEQIDSWHDRITDTHIEQEAHGEDFCGGFDYPLLWEGRFQSNGHGVTRGDGLVYFGESIRVVDTWTNTESGATYVNMTAARNADVKIVDNGDGTLTITWAARGTTSIWVDGDLIARDAGRFSGQVLIDHGGTPGDPSDDEFLADIGEVSHVGLAQLGERDLCEDLHTYLD